MIYRLAKRMIENGNYETKEEMVEKLDVFYLNGRITKEQYEELLSMLA